MRMMQGMLENDAVNMPFLQDFLVILGNVAGPQIDAGF